MHDFIMGEDSNLWDAIKDGPFISKREVKIEYVTSQVPKAKKEFDDANRKKKKELQGKKDPCIWH